MDFNEFERVKFQLLPGDLLVCEGGDVGRTAIWQGEIDECYYQKAIHRLRPKKKNVSNQFMLYFMRYAYDSGAFRLFTSQSSIAHLTQEKLSTVRMLLPKTQEQEQISVRCSSLSERIELFTQNNQKLNDLKDGVMHDLLRCRIKFSLED
jgi:type I restriction enzyme S subunit